MEATKATGLSILWVARYFIILTEKKDAGNNVLFKLDKIVIKIMMWKIGFENRFICMKISVCHRGIK